jgi:CheY-like chemotaxis protein
MKKRLLFGFGDVLSLEAWLDYFEGKGYEVDGAMSGEDLFLAAKDFKPDILIAEYKLKGEMDGLGVYYGLSSELPSLSLVLICDLAPEILKKLNTNFVQSAGILNVIKPGELSFEVVEELV